eukprot:3008736-Rhodomonas_salina.1
MMCWSTSRQSCSMPEGYVSANLTSARCGMTLGAAGCDRDRTSQPGMTSAQGTPAEQETDLKTGTLVPNTRCSDLSTSGSSLNLLECVMHLTA